MRFIRKLDTMKYEGDINDLVFYTEPVNFYYITFNDKCYKINDKITFESYQEAKENLIKYIYVNFCQGHYWHKNKDNTFSKNEGWLRNNGLVSKSQKEFEKMSVDLTEYLLDEKIFIIKSNINN